MLRIYLHLNKWIDLARAISGGQRGGPFQSAATVIRPAVERGEASFPLLIGHYIETWKQRKTGPRHELAQVMAAVSCNHAISAHAQLLPGGLDRGLQRRFGRPTSLRPFGCGVSTVRGDLLRRPHNECVT